MTDKTQEILDAVKGHLVGRGIEGDKVVLDAHLLNDLDLDSLDTVELTVAIEDTYGIEIPDAELEAIETIRDTVELIESKLSVGA